MDNNIREKISNYVNANRSELSLLFVELLGEMVAQPTINVVESKLGKFPSLKEPGEEIMVANIIKKWADKEGFSYEIFARSARRENLIISYGEEKGKTLFVPGHMDVVPPGDGWDTDPLTLTVDGDTVYGRGVADNKGQLTAILISLKILKDCNIKPNGKLLIAALADEEATSETGVDFGMGFLLEEKLITADFAIVPDIGGEMHDIDVAEKGRVLFEVSATGKQAHGSTPELGINAINCMAEFLVNLKNHKFLYKEHQFLKNHTVNVGEITGGAAANIVPGNCMVSIDMRLVPGQTPEALRTELLSLTNEIDGEFKVAIKTSVDPHETDPKSPLVKTIQNITESICGFRPQPMGMGGGTYAKALNRHGIEAVGFSTGNGAAMHVANEFASIKEHINFAEVLCLVSLDLLS